MINVCLYVYLYIIIVDVLNVDKYIFIRGNKEIIIKYLYPLYLKKG